MGIEDYLEKFKGFGSITRQLNEDKRLHSTFYDAIRQVSESPKGLLGLLQPSNPSYSMIRELEENIKRSSRERNELLRIASDKTLGIEDTITDEQTAYVGTALSRGFKFDSAVQKALTPVYDSWLKQNDVLTISDESKLLGSAFQDLLKPSVYMEKSQGFVGAVTAVSALQKALPKNSGFAGAEKGLAQSTSQIDISGAIEITNQVSALGKVAESLIDKSWLSKDSPWMTAISALTTTSAVSIKNAEQLDGLNSSFADLVRLERKTADMFKGAGIDRQMTSVSMQIASISRAWADEMSLWRKAGAVPPSSKFVADYMRFASIQHKTIQKAVKDEREEDASWRIDVLDATSKFVDRQVTWEAEHDSEIIDIAGESAPVNNAESSETIEHVEVKAVTETPITESADAEKQSGNGDVDFTFSTIPQSISYTNQDGNSVTVSEAFEKSAIIELTELAKSIVDGVFNINSYREDLKKRAVFSHTHKGTKSLAYMGILVVDSEEKFKDFIDDLYFLFYENLEHIKEVVGDGDKEGLGTKIVQNEEAYQVVFRIKTIRTDLQHDYEHGKPKDIEKKKKVIDEAYRHYGIRPRRPKEYKAFQKNVYKELSVLVGDLFNKVQDDREKMANQGA